MKIYGVGLLAFCFLVGKLLGLGLGRLINLSNDVGGVGFAMLLLIVLSGYMRKKQWIDEKEITGITFWSAMYIPVIIAMAASLNAKAAYSAGWLAIAAGGLTTLVGFILVPLITKIGASPEHIEEDGSI